MKKYLILIFLAGCGYAQINNSEAVIITKIIQDKGICEYYGSGKMTTLTLTSWDFKFIDSCGKFQIGDTLNIVKK